MLDKFQDTQRLVAERERAFVAKAKADQERKEEQLQYAVAAWGGPARSKVALSLTTHSGAAPGVGHVRAAKSRAMATTSDKSWCRTSSGGREARLRMDTATSGTAHLRCASRRPSASHAAAPRRATGSSRSS